MSIFLTFNVGGKTSEKLHFIPVKAQFSLLSSKTMGVLLSPQYPLCHRACMHSKKKKIFKNLNIRNIQNNYHRKSPSQKLHSYNCNITFHLELMLNSVGLKILGLKLAKLDYIIIWLDLDTTKKARKELDGTRGQHLVKIYYNMILKMWFNSMF